MTFYKVTLTIEKIVECESSSRAVELARSDISESDLYHHNNWTQYELDDSDMQAEHNKAFNLVN